ncbi:hypothetical protein [Scytonema sp. NUACC26]|uniref:hypothetical protein n=1 Tax=Scytonema sp. NUACC26 TaxID=3140176 RepID=UPI0038B3681A
MTTITKDKLYNQSDVARVLGCTINQIFHLKEQLGGFRPGFPLFTEDEVATIRRYLEVKKQVKDYTDVFEIVKKADRNNTDTVWLVIADKQTKYICIDSELVDILSRCQSPVTVKKITVPPKK